MRIKHKVITLDEFFQYIKEDYDELMSIEQTELAHLRFQVYTFLARLYEVYYRRYYDLKSDSEVKMRVRYQGGDIEIYDPALGKHEKGVNFSFTWNGNYTQTLYINAPRDAAADILLNTDVWQLLLDIDPPLTLSSMTSWRPVPDEVVAFVKERGHFRRQDHNIVMS